VELTAQENGAPDRPIRVLGGNADRPHRFVIAARVGRRVSRTGQVACRVRVGFGAVLGDGEAGGGVVGWAGSAL